MARFAAALALAAALGAATRAAAGPGIPCTDASAARAAAARQATPGRLAGVSTPPDTSAFVLFGWVSPPADSTTEARIAEMADMGLNLLLPASLDEGCPDDNHARLDWAAAHDMRCLIWDSRLIGAFRWLPTFEDSLNEVVAEYRDHPGLWGYYLGDEPPRANWPLLTRLRAALRERDPLHPGWNTLRGRASFVTTAELYAELRDYSAMFLPAVLSADHYDFRYGGDAGRFVENLVALRTVSRERGLPFWNIIQLVPHGSLRPLTEGEMRWQVSQSLAFGASGIGYFTYWTPHDRVFDWQPAIIDTSGRRTAWYDFLRGFNVGVRAAGEILTRTFWIRTTFAGSVPLGGTAFTPGNRISHVAGRAAIGEFVGEGGPWYVLVANSDSLMAQTIELRTHDSPGATIAAGGAAPFIVVPQVDGGARIQVTLAAGDFVLLELAAPVQTPRVRVWPNPARSSVAMTVRVPSARGELAIHDVRGRVVRTFTLRAPLVALAWDGRDDGGRRVPPGLYFARMTDHDASPSSRSFVWLGAR